MITDEMIVQLRLTENAAWAAYQSHIHSHPIRSCCEDALATWNLAERGLNRALAMKAAPGTKVVEV